MSKQEQALELIEERSCHEGVEVYIGGVAGSGKTYTLVQAYNMLLDVVANYDDVMVVAPTNKAAHVMRQRGIPAGTIHSFMYNVEERELKDDEGNFIRDDKGKIKTELVWHHKLDAEKEMSHIPLNLLVDECSMIGGRLYKDLMRFPREYGTNIYFFGDAFQLPPVKDEVIFQVRQPDVFLDEVHRVAAGNPVLEYATFIRENASHVSYPKWEDFPRASFRDPRAKQMMCEEGAQVIAWTNNFRKKVNTLVRDEHGMTNVFPQEGERLIVLNNVPNKKLYNGTFIRVKEIEDRGDFLVAQVIVEDDEDNVVEVDMNKALFHEEGMYKTTKGNIQADFAYCITAHKSQGSEWPNVIVVDQRQWMKEEELRRHWYYTAITRTRERLQIVK